MASKKETAASDESGNDESLRRQHFNSCFLGDKKVEFLRNVIEEGAFPTDEKVRNFTKDESIGTPHHDFILACLEYDHKMPPDLKHAHAYQCDERFHTGNYSKAVFLSRNLKVLSEANTGSKHFVHLVITNETGSKIYRVIVVHMPSLAKAGDMTKDKIVKEWTALREYIRTLQGEHILMGDFNIPLHEDAISEEGFYPQSTPIASNLLEAFIDEFSLKRLTKPQLGAVIPAKKRDIDPFVNPQAFVGKYSTRRYVTDFVFLLNPHDDEPCTVFNCEYLCNGCDVIPAVGSRQQWYSDHPYVTCTMHYFMDSTVTLAVFNVLARCASQMMPLAEGSSAFEARQLYRRAMTSIVDAVTGEHRNWFEAASLYQMNAGSKSKYHEVRKTPVDAKRLMEGDVHFDNIAQVVRSMKVDALASNSFNAGVHFERDSSMDLAPLGRTIVDRVLRKIRSPVTLDVFLKDLSTAICLGNFGGFVIDEIG